VTFGPIVRLWREARRSGTLPGSREMAEARVRTGWQHLRLTPGARLVTFDQPGMTLDFGGIVKGYACDEALRAMRALGVTSALVEAGGDMAASGPPPGAQGWRVVIQGLPGRTFRLANRALSTSGDAAQFVEIGGARFSHIVDPRTGLGVTHGRQVSVFAREGLLADPLATALSVMDPASGRALARRFGAHVICR
jgi:thiamine biosynthesis lipoprotein